MKNLRELMEMKGRTAVITGGAGNIGRAAAAALAELGASIVLLDLDEAKTHDAAAQIAEEWKVPACGVALDLENEQSVRAAAARVQRESASLNVLIHSAALVGTTPLEGWAVPFSEQSSATWRRALEVNLTSFFVLVQACENSLRKARGNVIAIGSIYGVCGPDLSLYEGTQMGNPSAYGASKGGLLQMVRYLSTALAPEVRVNAISPGGISRGQSPAFVEKYSSRTPLGRMGVEEDMKGAVAFLASDLSAYVTGQNLMVDGGWTAMVKSFTIGQRSVGPGHPCFIIAEAGVNHDGSLDQALKLIDAAADGGADAVKFQTFKADSIVTSDAPMADYQKTNTGRSESQREMLRRLEMPEAWHERLKAHCEQRGVAFMSTPFDEDCADFLHGLGVSAFKTPSGELTNLGYLSHIARFGLPMIVSTGMASLGEVEDAVRCIQSVKSCGPLALLHCVSAYPARLSTLNLRAMITMQSAFDVVVGYSDHTLGFEAGIAAVALGASVMEKHLTLDSSLPGPDHKASLEPAPFKSFVQNIRDIEQALGHGQKEPTEEESNTAAVARKSITVARNLKSGAVLKAEDLVMRRPGTGLAPKLLPYLVGRCLRTDVAAGTQITFEQL